MTRLSNILVGNLAVILALSVLGAFGCERHKADRPKGDPVSAEDLMGEHMAEPGAKRAISCPQGTTARETVNGVVVETACVRPDGTRHGRMIGRYRDGRVAVEGEYRDGLEVGTWTWWDRGSVQPPVDDPSAPSPDRGARIREGEYRDGKRVGIWREWDPQGTVIAEETYDQDGRPSGTWKRWWNNGQLQQETVHVDGSPSGLQTRFHASGNKSEEGTLSSGKRVGEWTSWHANGQKHWQGSYQDDKQAGAWSWWDESGKLTKKCTYTDDGEEVSCDESP
jgi:antitoxin component YwqK of YwqJK toxin-antitoxin module